ncbi:MAG: hypothetical protein AB7S41_00535 [Parvibaculaceae bacterium]
MRTTIATAVLFGLLGVTSAYAQGVTCDKASMDKMNSDISAMNGAGQMKEKKDMAMKEMMSAQEAMAASKMDECTTHMNNAMQAMQGSSMDGQSGQMDSSGQMNTAEPTVGTKDTEKNKADSPQPQ